MERFYGSFEYSLDAKGRLILPARLRAQFDTKRALVSCYVDRCLAVWTHEQFEQHLGRAEAKMCIRDRKYATQVRSPCRQFCWNHAGAFSARRLARTRAEISLRTAGPSSTVSSF